MFGVSGNEQFVISACKSECHDEQDDVYLGNKSLERLIAKDRQFFIVISIVTKYT